MQIRPEEKTVFKMGKKKESFKQKATWMSVEVSKGRVVTAWREDLPIQTCVLAAGILGLCAR